MNTRLAAVARLGGVGVSTLAVALLGWLTLVLAARNLGPDEYAHFAVLWGLFFALAAVMFGVQQEVTQSLTASVDAPGDMGDATRGGRLVAFHGLVVAALLTVVVAAMAAWWASDVADGYVLELLLVLAVCLASLSLQSGVTGVVVARDQLRLFGALIVVAATVRLLAVVAVTMSSTSTPPLMMLAIASGSFAWLALIAAPRVRSAVVAKHPQRLSKFLKRSSGAIVAALASGLLAAGFPLLLDLRTTGPLPASAGVLLTAVVLTRTPLLLPMNGLQLVLLARLTKQNTSVVEVLRVLILFVPAICLIVGLGYVLGPEVQQLMFGEEYRSSRGVMALLSLAACLLVGLTITGTVLAAKHRFGASAWGWVWAVIGTFVALGFDGTLETRSTVALIAGPLVGLIVHGICLAQPQRGSGSDPHT